MQANVTSRRALSLTSMIKLIVFSAVACLCVTPMIRLWQAGVVEGGSLRGLLGVLIFEALVVPLAWIPTSFIIIAPGARRDRLITQLLLCSVSVALGMACWMLFSFTIPVVIRQWTLSGTRRSLVAVGLHVTVVATLSAAFWYLLLRLRGRLRREP